MRRVSKSDFIRIAEAIKNLDLKSEIKDRNSFDDAYDDYFDDNDYFRTTPRLRDRIFQEYSRKNKSLFVRAGGKDFAQDRRYDAKVIVTDPDKYVRKGSKNVDLSGYDTKKRSGGRKEFNFIGEVKGKIVYAKKVEFINKKPQTRYRDRLGRFVRVVERV